MSNLTSASGDFQANGPENLIGQDGGLVREFGSAPDVDGEEWPQAAQFPLPGGAHNERYSSAVALRDTSAKASQVYFQQLAAISPAERVRLGAALWRAAQSLQ